MRCTPACLLVFLVAVPHTVAQGPGSADPRPEPSAATPEPAEAPAARQVAERQAAERQAAEPQKRPQDRHKVLVTATRRAEDPFDLPFATDVVDSTRLRQRSYRTVPQALRDTPGVMVQETSHAQGSPYIRGFTGYQNVLLIDGVRLNNSVFRSGPNQYWSTIDTWSLDRIEVVKGPSSVLYGSDAVGGTVAVFSRNPEQTARRVAGESGVSVGGRSYLRYSTAEDSIQARGEVGLGLEHDSGSRTSLLIGGTFKHFGDLEGGADTGVQTATGYDDKALDLKAVHHIDDHHRLVFLHQSVRQDDAPRTHRTVDAVPFAGTTSGGDAIRRFDQHRYLSYLQYHGEDLGGPFDAIHANLSWQMQKEERYRVRTNNNEEFQGFEVGTLGAWINFESETEAGAFTYGVEYYRDFVDSFLRRPIGGSAADAIQGPVADDATYDLIGVFVQDQIPVSENVELILGGRFTYAAADADSVLDPTTNLQTSLDDDWSSLTGSARIRWGVIPDRLNLFGGVSQGFRAPNLSDLTRLDSARTNEIETPSTNLEPEDYIQYEGGARYEDADVSAEATYFYTDISDQIVRFPTGVVIGGDNEVTKANVGDGYIQGVELGSAVRAPSDLTVFGNLTWTEGRISNFENPASSLTYGYPTRLMPLTWQAGVRWDDARGRGWLETVVVHANGQDKLSFSDQQDTSRIPPGGTPGYTLWHIRAGWQVTEDATLQVLLENLTDADYRVHGSGLNGPGRNLIVGMELTF